VDDLPVVHFFPHLVDAPPAEVLHRHGRGAFLTEITEIKLYLEVLAVSVIFLNSIRIHGILCKLVITKGVRRGYYLTYQR
jgi:hypothetical protein